MRREVVGARWGGERSENNKEEERKYRLMLKQIKGLPSLLTNVRWADARGS